MPEDVQDRMREWVLHPEYPCLGARAVFNRDRAHVATTGRLGTPASSLEVYRALREFGASADPDAGFTSLLVAFGGPPPTTERAFEEALWRTLQHLCDFDDTPWNPEVSSDPEDVDFSFSIGGTAFFVVGLHPNASRTARRAPWPILTFNLHAQFEQLKESERYGRMRDTIRDRDIELQGSLNPMVADHGTVSEARQYSGREVPDSWQAPLTAAGERDTASSSS